MEIRTTEQAQPEQLVRMGIDVAGASGGEGRQQPPESPSNY